MATQRGDYLQLVEGLKYLRYVSESMVTLIDVASIFDYHTVCILLQYNTQFDFKISKHYHLNKRVNVLEF